MQYRLAADLPDAGLVAPCDVSDRPVRVNGDLAEELPIVRAQRDKCAKQVDGVAQWRAGAVIRIEEANKGK